MEKIIKCVTGFFIACLLSSGSFLTGGFAESFKIVGSRPLGMGGSFVAVAEDSLAQYWNPAGIAVQKKLDLEIPVGAMAEFTGGILQNVNTIGELADQFTKVQDAQKNGTVLDISLISSIFKTASSLNDLNKPDRGVLIAAQGGTNLRIMRFALSINNFTSLGADPFVDIVNIGLGSNPSLGNVGVSFSANKSNPPSANIADRDALIAPLNDIVGLNTLTQLTGSALSSAGITNTTELANSLINAGIAAGLTNQQISDAVAQIAQAEPGAKSLLEMAVFGGSYNANKSNVTLRGISITEIAIGYAHHLFLKDLYAGANLKTLVGQVGFHKQEFLNSTVSGNDLLNNFDKSSKTSLQPGVDLGVLYDKREKWRTKLGVVARNVNSPTFDQPELAIGEAPYQLQPQLRAGVAIYPLKKTFWVIASDIDLTSNNTLVPGFHSRMWGLGTELNLVNSNLFSLGLRAGFMKNLLEEESYLTYTSGFGLKFLHFFLDTSGALSSKTEQIKSGEKESLKVPQNFQVGIAIGLNF